VSTARLYTLLFWGRDRAATIGAIAESAGCARREVEKAAELLRADGAPLCSGAEGLWLSDSPEELLAQVDALRRRAIHQLVNARALRRTARSFARQQQLALW